jgi:hypothetical protein
VVELASVLNEVKFPSIVKRKNVIGNVLKLPNKNENNLNLNDLSSLKLSFKSFSIIITNVEMITNKKKDTAIYEINRNYSIFSSFSLC